jgi:gas vesicle protein
MEEAVYAPEAETHMGPEAKDHQQVQAWTEEGYISEGSGDGPDDSEEQQSDDSEEEQPDPLANATPQDLAFVLRERCSAYVMSQPEGADAFFALHKVDPVQAGHWVLEQSTPPEDVAEVLQHPIYQDFLAKFRAGIIASSSRDVPQSSPAPVSGRLLYAALEVAHFHHYDQAQNTFGKHVEGLKSVATAAIGNLIQLGKQQLEQGPVRQLVRQSVADLREEIEGIPAQVENIAEHAGNEVKDFVNNELNKIRNKVAAAMNSQQHQIDGLKKQLKSMKAAMTKKAAKSKKTVKKTVKKVMKKASPKKKSMKKHSHV